jgi:cell division protein FtsI/penicillin-binding protein 2
VLEAGIASPSTPFPVQTAATLSGVKLENANGESCGGTLAQSFAQSCNSVFAPLGAKLGAKRLVDVATRFGWNEDPGIAGASTPSIPAAAAIGDDLAVGSSAIGQGRVQSTALQMALVAATIADRGRRPRPTLLFGERRPKVRATSARVARTVQRLMRGVVAFGTGTAAALPGVVVAGKTGTAELESTVKPPGTTPPPETGPTPPAKIPETDAWFAAMAPAGPGRKPRAAVGVLLVRAGAGGEVAAPAARTVLQAALAR